MCLTGITTFHSKCDSRETAVPGFQDGSLKISDHCYRSNWVVGGSGYGFIQGMPWHTEEMITADYENKAAKKENSKLIEPFQKFRKRWWQ